MRTTRSTSHLHRGFTLIELMVAMALGLMTTIIIAEVMLKSEGNRRTTTDGSDAQLNGALALYAMQRDITMAGYGIISTPAVLGCTVKGQYGNQTAQSFTLAPVKIDAGATGDVSDTVTMLRSGSSSGYAIPVTTTSIHASSDTAFIVQSSVGVSAGDTMLAMPTNPDASNWCTIFTVQASAGSVLNNTTIPHVAASNTWNQATTLMPASYINGSTLAKISQLVYRSFVISNGNLVAKDLITDAGSTSTNTIGTQIVLMKAYYGRDTDNDGVVDTYDTTTPTTTAGWKQVQTIRIAIVARSGQREKTDLVTGDVTKINPLWDVGTATTVSNATACGNSKCITLQVHPSGSTDTEWQHYRYKVFDTVIPLRNMLWTS